MNPYNLIDFPKRYKASDYQDEINSYISKVKCVPGVRTIYTMGSIKAPGLSDIDVILIVDDNFDNRYSKHLSTEYFNQELFIHGPIIIPLHLTKDFQYLIFATNLKRVYGSDSIQKLEDLPEEERNILDLAYLVDFQESRLIQYYNELKNDSISVRMWMTRLWSLTHSEEILRRNSIEIDEDIKRILNLIKSLRSDWQDGKKIQEGVFLECFSNSFMIYKRFIQLGLESLYSPYLNDFEAASLTVNNKRFIQTVKDKAYKYQVKSLKFNKYNFQSFVAPVEKAHLLHFSVYGFGGTDNSLIKMMGSKAMILRKRSKIAQTHWKWLDNKIKGISTLSAYLGSRPMYKKDLKAMIRSFIESKLN